MINIFRNIIPPWKSWLSTPWKSWFSVPFSCVFSSLFGKNQLERSLHLPYGKLTWPAGKWAELEDVFPSEMGIFQPCDRLLECTLVDQTCGWPYIIYQVCWDSLTYYRSCVQSKPTNLSSNHWVPLWPKSIHENPRWHFPSHPRSSAANLLRWHKNCALNTATDSRLWRPPCGRIQEMQMLSTAPGQMRTGDDGSWPMFTSRYGMIINIYTPTCWCSTPTQLLICSSFNRENGHPLLNCSSLSTAQPTCCWFILRNVGRYTTRRYYTCRMWHGKTKGVRVFFLGSVEANG